MNDTLSSKETNVVQEILVDILAIEPSQITPDARLTEDLGADSLHKVEIALAIDEAFHLSVPDEDWESVSTVGDIYERLAKLLDSAKQMEG